MNNKRICELAAGWEQATYNIFHDRTVKLQEIEENLRNTYRNHNDNRYNNHKNIFINTRFYTPACR